MSPLRHSLCTLGLLLTLGVGCASRTDQVQKQLGELQRDLRVLRAESAAMRERLDALEDAAPKRSAKASSAGEAAGGGKAEADRPKLEVVRLSPEAPGSDGWVTIDPSDPRRASSPSTAAADGPTTEIRSDRGGGVVQRSVQPDPNPAQGNKAAAKSPPPRQ